MNHPYFGPLRYHKPKTSWGAAILIILLTALAMYLIIRSSNIQFPDYPKPTLRPAHADAKMTESPIIHTKGFLANVGAFSDVECGSDWCNRHEQKDNQVALNYQKFGKHSKIYIPAYNKTYRVVGGTYCGKNCKNFDLEIWFGSDQQAALDFGHKDLRINFLD